MSKPRIIAFYLPQYHPFKENDEWWGKGFTEWTNVGKAKSLFKGHDQPRVPTELGYYDLRLPIVREQQVQLAKEAGVSAFCYWHYWFGNGRRLIADIFDEVLSTGKPDFPFCLGWANHSWMAKNWNSDGTTSEKMLMEQTYPGENDAKLHFEFLLKAFSDPRYLKVDGAPLFYIFAPQDLPSEYIENFRKWTKDAGFPDLYLVANIAHSKVNKSGLLSKGYSAVTYQRLGSRTSKFTSGGVGRRLSMALHKIKGFFVHRPPFMEDYAKCYHDLVTEEEKEEKVIPTLLPQWDHTPRSGWNGRLLVNSTPKNFYLHAKEVLNIVRGKSDEHKIIFLKSWNEWGEGNYMEPDLTNGRGFIEALRTALDEYGE